MVSRKLNELMYYSSYLHRGSYYTLEKIANFDNRGFAVYGEPHVSTAKFLKIKITP
ncbi:MAG: hypothetical protein ABW168_23725 [Sedimenticola sp.]